MKVPEKQIPDIVSIINGYPHVTHNYRRENVYNLWFTVNTRNGHELNAVTEEIKRRAGIKDSDILDLRTIRVFKIDVRFKITQNGSHSHRATQTTNDPVEMDEMDRGILRITQRDIPIVPEPFREISEQLGIDQTDVVTRLERQVRNGIVKRVGGSINQRKLGITANAVVAWNVPENRVEETGSKLASYDAVTHCYERRPVRGYWEYNLFTVLHGYDRGSVKQCAERFAGALGIPDYCVLFSNEQFKRTSVIHELSATCQN